MKIILFFIQILFISFHAVSQVYFNNRYNLTGEWLWDFSSDIISVNGGYVMGAETGSPDNVFRRRIAFTGLDSAGNLIWVKYYGELEFNYAGGYAGCLIHTIDSGYAFVGVKSSSYPGWIRDRGLLMKLDANFDTLWTKAYGDQTDPCDTSYIFRQVIQLNDQGYVILCGIMDYNDQRPHIVLVRTDYQGNVLWKSFLGIAPYHYFPYSISKTSDSGYIIGCIRWISGFQLNDPFVFKVDSLGNEQWSKNLGSEYGEWTAIVNQTIDNNIIAGYIKSDSIIGTDSYYGKKWFSKFDNNGNLIWEKKFGIPYLNNELWSMKVLSDGRIISTGRRQTFYPAVPYMFGWMFCIGPEGDSLWYREYTLLNGQHSWNYFYDVIPTNDSGFIACGSVYPVSPDTGTQDVWVVKVDSIGCESPSYCWVNVEEKNVIPAEKGKMILFPNPAVDHITLGLRGENFSPGSEVVIYNIFGQVQEKLVVTVTSERLLVNVSGWPPGIYIVRISLKGDRVLLEKFVVE